MQAIPIEQQVILIGGLITLLISGIAGAGYLFRLWFLQKLDENKIEMQSRFDAEKAKREREYLEVQQQLDVTQSGREMQRLFFSEQAEFRKEAAARESAIVSASAKRDEQFSAALKEIVIVSQNIQTSIATNLEVLKLHAESDGVMAIRQEKIMKQNDKTHEQILDLASSLDAVIIKVEGLVNGRMSDTKILEDMRGALVLIHSGVKHLEDVMKPKFDDTIDLSNGAKEFTEAQKELNQHTNEESKGET